MLGLVTFIGWWKSEMFHQKMQATGKGGSLTFFLVELGVILH